MGGSQCPWNGHTTPPGGRSLNPHRSTSSFSSWLVGLSVNRVGKLRGRKNGVSALGRCVTFHPAQSSLGHIPVHAHNQKCFPAPPSSRSAPSTTRQLLCCPKSPEIPLSKQDAFPLTRAINESPSSFFSAPAGLCPGPPSFSPTGSPLSAPHQKGLDRLPLISISMGVDQCRGPKAAGGGSPSLLMGLVTHIHPQGTLPPPI